SRRRTGASTRAGSSRSRSSSAVRAPRSSRVVTRAAIPLTRTPTSPSATPSTRWSVASRTRSAVGAKHASAAPSARSPSHVEIEDEGAQQLGDARGLRGTAARAMGGVAVCDLRDLAEDDALVRRDLDERAQVVVHVHVVRSEPERGADVEAEQVRPRGALVIGDLAFGGAALEVRGVARIVRREAPNAVGREQLGADAFDDFL